MPTAKTLIRLDVQADLSLTLVSSIRFVIAGSIPEKSCFIVNTWMMGQKFHSS